MARRCAHVFAKRREPLTSREFVAIARPLHFRRGAFHSPEQPEYLAELRRVNITASPWAPERLEAALSRRAFLAEEHLVFNDPLLADDLMRAKQYVLLTECSPSNRDGELLRIAMGVRRLLGGSLEIDGTHHDDAFNVLARRRLPERIEPCPPSPLQVARRALILAAARFKAETLLAQEKGRMGVALDLYNFAMSDAVKEELSPDEHEFFHIFPTVFGISALLRAERSFEALPVLTWALGVTELPKHDEPADPRTIAVGQFGAEPAILNRPALRPFAEILRLRREMEELEAPPDQPGAQPEEEETIHRRERILRQRRRALRWLLGLAPSYADASPFPFSDKDPYGFREWQLA